MTGAAGQKRVPEDFVRDFRLPVTCRSRSNAPSPTTSTGRRRGWMRWWRQRSGCSGCWPRSAGRSSPAPSPAALIPAPPFATPASPGSARFRRIGGLPDSLSTCRASSTIAERRPRSQPPAFFLSLLATFEVVTSTTLLLRSMSKPLTMKRRCVEESLKLGDLLITTEAPLGQAAIVDREDIALAQRVIKLDYEPLVLLNAFVLQWILAEPFQYQLSSLATGSTALGIKGERLHMLRTAIPPVSEQQAIVAHIAAETSKLEELHLATERTIMLLKERRAALITAAVTGQIDLGGVA